MKAPCRKEPPSVPTICFPTVSCLPSLPGPRETWDCLTCHQVGPAPGAEDCIELGFVCSQAVLASCVQLLNRQRGRRMCNAGLTTDTRPRSPMRAGQRLRALQVDGKEMGAVLQLCFTHCVEPDTVHTSLSEQHRGF